ncbi:pPIWI_RE_Z domain-containing protein, partial [Paenibacillus sp. YK5]
MRVSYWTYFEQIFPRLLPSGLPRQSIETIYTVELFVTGCLMIDPFMDIREGYTILSGYDSPVLPKHARKEIAHRLRVLYSALRSRMTWDNLFEQYEEISVEYRLYEYDGECWRLRIPALFSDRRNWYEQLLEQAVAHQSKDIHFATSGKFHYYKYNQDHEPIRYGGEIPSLAVKMPQFPRYRPKGKFSLHLGDDHTYQTEGMREASAASEWKERAGIGLKLKSLTDPQIRQFEYKDLQHIVGGLGSGKSTFMILETERLVRAGARIGFIESSVPQVLNRVKELRLLGINAVPVIGRSGRRKHQKDYISTRRHQIRDVTDWGQDSYLELQHVSDFCIIHALANDYEDTADYPCRQLWQQEKKCICPYAASCGIYRDFATLINAEVWVTTSASILKTKLPIMLDPYERTIYEAMYDLLDIIFVDEADAVQKQYDDAFVSEIALFGNSQHLFEKTLLESFRKTIGHYGKYAHDEVVQEWMDVLNRLESTIRRGVYRTLNLSPEYAQFLYRKLLRLTTEAYRISGAFAKDEKNRKRIEQELHDYADDPLEHHIYTNVAKMLQGRTKKEREQVL